MLKSCWPLLLITCWLDATAHGGGLDKYGCHHDRKNGGYHCHRAAASQPASPPSQPEAQALETRRPPQCFVGPRGGTYTITASGKKNYKGC